MPISTGGGWFQQSSNRPAYRTSFIQRSHLLIKLGYERLNPRSFAASKEEEITGELVKAMQQILEAQNAPRWGKHLWAHEEERVHDPVRRGKFRLRIDILIIRHQVGPRPRFRIEAKRLSDSASRRSYLGTDGLGCFPDGRYAAEDQIAGMLGYVQNDTVEIHAKELQRTLGADPGRHCIATDGQWTTQQMVENLATYRSVHTRQASLGEIVILHSFLVFM